MSGLPSWAVKGARVVCIFKGKPGDMLGIESFPTYGEVCTIREVQVRSSGVYLPLEEHVNPVVMTTDGMCERAALVCHFRPVKTIEDDISEHFAVYLKTPVRTSIRAGERV